MSVFARCEEIQFSFGNVTALDSVSLELRSGEISAVVGPNGAGKTTLIDVLSGRLHLQAGKIFIRGSHIVLHSSYGAALEGISRTFQEPRVVRLMTTLDNVLLARPRQSGERFWNAIFGMHVSGEERENRTIALRWLHFVGLDKFANVAAGQLSYGQRKLLALGCCLATDARLLLLDEPTTGVHPEMAGEIMRILGTVKEQGKAVLIVEHDFNVVRRIADHVIVLDHGRLVASGSPQVLDTATVKKCFVR